MDVLFDDVMSGLSFIQEYDNDELCVCCILKKDDICIAKLDFYFIIDKTFTKDDIKINSGKVVVALNNMLIASFVEDKRAIVKKFIQIIPTTVWGNDQDNIHRIEVYLDGKYEYEDIISEEGYTSVPYKDVYEQVWDTTKDKTCYLYKDINYEDN